MSPGLSRLPAAAATNPRLRDGLAFR